MRGRAAALRRQRPRSSGCGCTTTGAGPGSARGCSAHLEDRARARGHAVVRLDTNDTLVEAIAMYERAGYRSIERYNDNEWARCWFEKRL